MLAGSHPCDTIGCVFDKYLVLKSFEINDEQYDSEILFFLGVQKQ